MPRILIADDNSNIQKMVTLALEGAGIEVVSVSNGGAAIRILPETAPDLVLADVFMPVRSGYEVCEFIKHEPRFSHVPVVLLVGAFDPLDESEALRVSADGILKKPFIPPEPLINMVKALLLKSLNERPEVPAAHNGHAAQEEAAKPSAAAPAVEDFSDAPPEELGPPQLEPDFGTHEETLAFGALLDIPIPPEAPAQQLLAQGSEPSTPIPTLVHRFAEEDESESLRPPRSNEFLGADIPELDQIAPSEDFLDEKLFTDVTPQEKEMDRAAPEPATDFSSEFPEFVPHFSPELDSRPYEAAPEAPIASVEPSAIAWESANVNPFDLQPPADLEAGEALAQDAMKQDVMERVEPERAEFTSEALEQSVVPAAADVAPATLFSVPVFPGSERLWASPPSSSAETEEAAKDAAEELKEEIPEIQPRAEAEPLPWPVSTLSDGLFDGHSDGLSAGSLAFEEFLARAVAPAEPAEAAEAAIPEAAVFEAFAVFEPVEYELEPAEHELEPVEDEMPFRDEMEEDLSRHSSPDFSADRSSIGAPHAEVAAAVKPAPDPELIEAVVARIVERMQPTVIEVVTREILRPLVEALVRREIDKP